MSSVLQRKNCYLEEHILNQNKTECMTSECRNTSLFFLNPGVTCWQGALGLTPQSSWESNYEGNQLFYSHLASKRETMTEAVCFLRRVMTARGGLKNFLYFPRFTHCGQVVCKSLLGAFSSTGDGIQDFAVSYLTLSPLLSAFTLPATGP